MSDVERCNEIGGLCSYKENVAMDRNSPDCCGSAICRATSSNAEKYEWGKCGAKGK